ncbi:hypothetical protein BV210_00470 [Halorientalis sp. IM1011]|uniref:DUF3828 domain-containing protein n=1 Tax=Halorientalis sp. IM1011 TaxID=1932360 RepID=UPI00097CCC21|nr:DUF3828 domain-containing protein [Halorientalis sp. IM1011]AQL41276.1 hypothetical protein BV210_00470 [Halorientalis sp. IM1011]
MDRASRRGYLAGLVGVAALSGCQDVLDRTETSGGSDQTDDDDDEIAEEPEQVHAVETFYAALDAGRFDVANRLLHNESTQPRVTEEQYGHLDAGSVSTASTELIDENEDSAVVRTNVRASATDPNREVDTTVDIELRIENGEWKLYSVRPADTSTETPVTGEEEVVEPTPDQEPTPDSGPAPTGDPALVVREFYAALDDGNRTAANDLIHSEARNIEVTRETAEAMVDASLAAENVSVVEAGADSATVEATVIFSQAGTEEEQSNRVRIELRAEDGRWKIYASGRAS